MTLDDEIRRGLTSDPKRLPSALLYDSLGSALFEAITHLPEYEVTRAGHRLLEAHADRMVAPSVPGRVVEIVELGPGAGRKAAVLVRSLRHSQSRVRFIGIDVSTEALAQCRRTLEAIDGVIVDAIEATYLEGLERAAAMRTPGASQLVLFLGSNLSNFDRDEAPAFLAAVRKRMRPGDALLLATDLDKDPRLLLPAYDDALGVTAAFDKNVLARLNREWGADFELGGFVHEARWNAPARRIEMHLRALGPQRVSIAKLGIRLEIAAGESIWTESSHRFSREELAEWARSAGFAIARQWIDEAWPFAQTLLEVPHVVDRDACTVATP